MGIPANTLRISIAGKIALTDVWNCSLWLRPVGEATAPTNGADAATLLATLCGGTEWTNLKAAILANMRSIDTIATQTMYSYAASGTTATASAQQADAGVGTGSAMTHPPQVCQVLTLLTGVAGRQHRGRIYLPATGVAVSSTTELATDTLSTVRSTISLWNKRNALLTLGWAMYVVSQTATSSLPVKTVRADNKLDVQRRRANKLIADATASTAMPWL